MKVLSLHDSATEEIFATMFRKRNLVPVIGAGFTKGAKSSDATVPDGEDFRGIMLSTLLRHNGEDAAFLSSKGFHEIAEYFMNENFVPRSEVKLLIKKYFTGVVLDSDRRAFLECPWPYIYTLNIDDGIESNSRFVNKIVPNREISTEAKSMLCVYKVHGDAVDEILFEEPLKLVFSTGQYIRSLTVNKSMLNSIQTDLVELNTIFVGCSLNNEIDLLYALAESKGAFPLGRQSIYVTNNVPNRFEEARLKSHGIESLVIVEDFSEFYNFVARVARRAVQNGEWGVSRFLCSRGIPNLGNNRDDNIVFFLRGSLEPEKSRAIPYFYASREIERSVSKSVNRFPITMIRGRRFCGKTLLLRSIANTEIARNVYLFDSTVRVSTETVDEILGIKNGLFIFDVNTLSTSAAESLAKGINKIIENNSSVVVAVNRTEPEVVGALVRYVDDEADFELDARLSAIECSGVNRRFDEMGILKIDCRKSLLDNAYSMMKGHPEIQSSLDKKVDLLDHEVDVLLVSAIADKAYSNLASVLSLRVNDIFTLCDKMAPVIEFAETSPHELRDTNSRYKIIVNSRLGLLLEIKYLIDTRGHRWLSERIGSVVSRLVDLPKLASIGHSMYMFDAINDLLSQVPRSGEATGYRPIVLSLYQSLQPILNSSPDYWLQRAKAILNLEENTKSITEGIEYAKKAYNEAERIRTVDNAEFTIALLCGKLCSLTNFREGYHVVSAVEWFFKAINNYKRNSQYVEAMLDVKRYRRNYFHDLCDYLEGEVFHKELLPIKGEIDYLVHVRRYWRPQGGRK